MEQTVISGTGVRKRVVAQTRADLVSAVSVATSETAPKVPDINNKSFANKRQRDL